MKKLLIAVTILFTSALLVCGTFYPNDPLVWLAGTTLPFEVTRAAIIALLLVLLFSTPPRALYVRYTIGAMSVLLISSVVVMIVNFQINFMDIIDFLEVAVLFAVEALESPRERSVKLAAVRTAALAE